MAGQGERRHAARAIDQKQEESPEALFLSCPNQADWCNAALETDTERDGNISGLRAVLGKDVEVVAVGITKGEWAGRVESVNVPTFNIKLLGGEAGELVSHPDRKSVV